jgi:sporulation protein YlmC with PRC-barrel domain
MSLEGLETFDAEVERAAEDSPLLESEARRFVGAPAFTPDGDELGTIQDLVMESDGVVQGLVLDVGSVLGLSERQVRIDWNEIIISADERVIVDMAVEDVQQLPPYSPP